MVQGELLVLLFQVFNSTPCGFLMLQPLSNPCTDPLAQARGSWRQYSSPVWGHRLLSIRCFFGPRRSALSCYWISRMLRSKDAAPVSTYVHTRRSRACDVCRRVKKPCRWLPEVSMCERCHMMGTQCEGAIIRYVYN